jgi:hypothetical protein
MDGYYLVRQRRDFLEARLGLATWPSVLSYKLRL